MKAAIYILKAFAKENVEHIFLVPGGLLDSILDIFEEVKEITPIVAAHEGGAAYMADGYSRAKNHFGVCFAIGGPGITNMATAILSAYCDNSAMIVLSGEVCTFLEGIGAFQDSNSAVLSDVEVLKPITKLSFSVENSKLITNNLHQGLMTMLELPKGPVHLSIPKNIQNAEISEEYVALDKQYYSQNIIDLKQANKIFEYLDSEKVVILAGDEIEKTESCELLIQFAEKYNIPIATTLSAKSAVLDTNYLSLGIFGYAGTRHSIETILGEEIEVLLIIGTNLSERDTMYWSEEFIPKKYIIHTNSNIINIGKITPVDLPIEANCNSLLQFLLSSDSKLKNLEKTKDKRSKWLSKIKQKPKLYDIANMTNDQTPIHPAYAISELRKSMPKNTNIVIDSGAHRAFASHYWSVEQHYSVFSATTLGPMGWAIPASIGIKLAKPKDICVVVTGDGCMLMHGIEIQTAAKYNIPIIFVVINNSAYANVYLRAKNENETAKNLTLLPNYSFKKFASSFGIEAIEVKDPLKLKEAFKKALDSNRPYLIDIKSSKDFPTPVESYEKAKKQWSEHKNIYD